MDVPLDHEVQLPSAQAGELPLYVDSSMLSTWRACKRKHFWSSIQALYPTGRSIHLVAGGAFAAGMEAVRKFVFSQPTPTSVTHHEMLQAAYPAFLQEWGDYREPPNHAKSFVNTFSALSYYLEQHPPASDVLQPYRRPDGSPAVEYRFAIPLPIMHPSGSPMLFVGRFDMIAMYVTEQAQIPCIQDEKTTYSMGVGWADSWDLRGQFIGYLWALRQQGMNISHAAIRGVAIQKTQFKVETALPQYPIHLIDRWYAQLIRDVTTMVDTFDRWKFQGIEKFHLDPYDTIGNYYPYNYADACGSYGGCAFATLCLQRDPEAFMTNYIRHRWDPLAKQPVKEIEKEGV